MAAKKEETVFGPITRKAAIAKLRNAARVLNACAEIVASLPDDPKGHEHYSERQMVGKLIETITEATKDAGRLVEYRYLDPKQDVVELMRRAVYAADPEEEEETVPQEYGEPVGAK